MFVDTPDEVQTPTPIRTESGELHPTELEANDEVNTGTIMESLLKQSMVSSSQANNEANLQLSFDFLFTPQTELFYRVCSIEEEN